MLFASRHMRVSRTEHICSKSLTLSHRAVVFFFALAHDIEATKSRWIHKYQKYTVDCYTILVICQVWTYVFEICIFFASMCLVPGHPHALFLSISLALSCRFHSIQCVMCVSCRYRYISTVPYVMPIDQYLLRHLYTVYFQFNVIIIFCSCMLMLLPISIFFYSLITC